MISADQAQPTAAQAAKEQAATAVDAHRARQAAVRSLLFDVTTAADPAARDAARERLAALVATDLGHLAAAVDVLGEADALRDAAVRNAERLGLAAEADHRRVHAALWPAIEAAAEPLRPTKGKTLKLQPWTGRLLQWRWDRAEAVEVADERSAVEDLEARLGWGEPERLGLVKVKPRLSITGLRRWLGVDRETGEMANEPPRGVDVTPRMERLKMREG